MSETTKNSAEEHSARGVQIPALGKKRTPAMDAMLRRVVPPAVGDGGISPLDVCAFNSSL